MPRCQTADASCHVSTTTTRQEPDPLPPVSQGPSLYSQMWLDPDQTSERPCPQAHTSRSAASLQRCMQRLVAKQCCTGHRHTRLRCIACVLALARGVLTTQCLLAWWPEHRCAPKQKQAIRHRPVPARASSSGARGRGNKHRHASAVQHRMRLRRRLEHRRLLQEGCARRT